MSAAIIAPPITAIRHEPGTEGLRGFAALLVLYTHLLVPAALDPAYSPWPGFMALEASQGAVLLFFILSGYVIGLTNQRPFTAANWRDYLRRRVIRLVPIYWLAVLLAVFVRPAPSAAVVAGNALFLQNSLPYGSWSIPLLEGNTNLWTLNYEVLYYLAFALCWWKPGAWPVWAAGALTLGIAGWALPGTWAPLTTGYAMGWFFWLLGYGLSRLPSVAAAAIQPLPWVSVMLFWLMTWQQKPLWAAARLLGLLPADDRTWINYSFIDILPASLVLLLAASGRRPRGTRLLCAVAAALPLGYLAWIAFRGRLDWTDHFPACTVLGAALWWWRPDGERAWGGLAWVGSISYALYVLQRPVQWWVHDVGWLPAGGTGAFVARLLLTLALTFAIAWLAEKKFQPWLRVRLAGRRALPA